MAKALRSPHLRAQVVSNKSKRHDRKEARRDLKLGKYNPSDKYLPALFSSRNGSLADRGYYNQKFMP